MKNRNVFIGFAVLICANVAFAGWENLPADSRNATTRAARLRLELELSRLDAPKIEARLSEILKSPRNAATARDYLVALELLAKIDGPLGAQHVRQHSCDPLTDLVRFGAVAAGWASTDPDAAEKWILTSRPEIPAEDRAELLRRLLRIETQASEDRAMKRVARLSKADATSAESFTAAVLEALIESGKFSRAWELTAQLDQPEARELARANLVALVAPYRPDVAREWFATLPAGGERTSALFRLAEALATQGFGVAMEFLKKLERSEQTVDALEMIAMNARDLDKTDLKALSDACGSDVDRNRVIAVAVVRINTLRGEQAWEWVGRMTDHSARIGVVHSLLSGRYRGNPAVVRSVIEQLDFLTHEERRTLLRRLERASPAVE